MFYHFKILKKAKKTRQKREKTFFSNYREGCGLFGHVDFDFEAIKKILNLKLQNVIFFLKKRGKNGQIVFS